MIEQHKLPLIYYFGSVYGDQGINDARFFVRKLINREISYRPTHAGINSFEYQNMFVGLEFRFAVNASKNVQESSA